MTCTAHHVEGCDRGEAKRQTAQAHKRKHKYTSFKTISFHSTFIFPRKTNQHTPKNKPQVFANKSLVSSLQFSGIAANTATALASGEAENCTTTRLYFHRKSWLITYITLEILTQVCKKNLSVSSKEQHQSHLRPEHSWVALAEQQALLRCQALAVDFILL